MNKNHRDRIAFMQNLLRTVYSLSMEVYHVQGRQEPKAFTAAADDGR